MTPPSPGRSRWGRTWGGDNGREVRRERYDSRGDDVKGVARPLFSPLWSPSLLSLVRAPGLLGGRTSVGAIASWPSPGLGSSSSPSPSPHRSPRRRRRRRCTRGPRAREATSAASTCSLAPSTRAAAPRPLPGASTAHGWSGRDRPPGRCASPPRIGARPWTEVPQTGSGRTRASRLRRRDPRPSPPAPLADAGAGS